MHLPPLEKFLVAIQTATLIGLSFHMWRAELHRVYINFFRYLLLALFDAIPLTIVTYGTTAYGYVWMATEALTLCFYALIVLECYATVFRNLGGIASISRRYIKVTVVVAALAAVLLAGLEKTPKTVFQYFYALDRGVVSTLLLFVLFITLFLVYYPIPLNRNVIVYSVGYAVYFLTKAVALFVRNIGDQRQPQVSAILIAISTGCLMFWWWALDRPGESKTVIIGHKWAPGDEERLLLQLQSINRSLSQAARK